MTFRQPLVGATKHSQVSRYANFDFLRLTAAYSVLISHAYPLSLGQGAVEPLWLISGRQIKLGTLAVLVFFTISGFLVTDSYLRRTNPIDFIWARFLRLAPGLFAALAVQAFLLGAAVTDMAVSDYFLNRGVYEFVLGGNRAFGNPGNLPGVFPHGPFGGDVNGSLWTLPYEAACYVGLLASGMLRLLRISVVVLSLLAGLILLTFWIGGDWTVFATAFLSGAMLRLLRLPLSGWLAGLSVCGLALGFFITGFRLAYPIFGSYLVIYLACSPSIRLPNVGRMGDLSYGVYIYAWPVQQTISWAFDYKCGPILSIVLAIPAVTALAWLSWHWVESPALALKSVWMSSSRGKAIGTARVPPASS